MYKDIDNKILLGNSIPMPEADMDDNESEINDEVEALHCYWYNVMLDNLGIKDFKPNYLSVKNQILNECSLNDQRELCKRILQKIKLIYGFVFYKTIDFNNPDEIQEFFDFIEFLEYDNEKFITDVWMFLDTNLSGLSIEEFCKRNSNQIINEIEEQIDSNSFNELITIFLRTYNKSNIIEWFLKKSEDNKTTILLRMMEGDEK